MGVGVEGVLYGNFIFKTVFLFPCSRRGDVASTLGAGCKWIGFMSLNSMKCYYHRIYMSKSLFLPKTSSQGQVLTISTTTTLNKQVNIP